jgi:hydroxymethylpyrimidine/phosphomethylpyrimidine kinase
MPKQKPYVLSIAGFDPSAGAGVLADIKTFESNDVYGFGVVSALTWQNDVNFEKVEWIDCYKIIQQAGILLRRFDIKYIKIGLIESMNVLHQLINFLHQRIKDPVIIYDPILKASTGFVFHKACHELFMETMHGMHCVTPNIPEAEQLYGSENLYAKLMHESKTVNIFLKGGHADDALSSDILFTKQRTYTFSNVRLPNGEKHGSGCVLSSALTAQLASGKNIITAADNANKYTYNFLASNETLLGYHNSVHA